MSDPKVGESRDCDACGVAIGDGAPRFTVAIQVYAPYDTLEIDVAELNKDLDVELRKLGDELERLEPDKASDDVARSYRFELCKRCQRAYLRSPLDPEWRSE